MRAFWRLGGVVGVLAVLFALLSIPTLHVQAQAQFGTNWTATFYNTTNLSGAVVATASFPSGISKSWGATVATDGANNPIPGLNVDNWSARFTSVQTFNAAPYDFVVTYDDGVRLFVNGSLVLDQFAGGGLQTSTVRVTLPAGTLSVIVEYFDLTLDATLQVSWIQVDASATSGTQTAATATPVAPATGVVVRVNGLAVRTGPYLGATLVSVARPANTYDIIARNESEGLFPWYYIKFGENRFGWVSGRYFETSGDFSKVGNRGSVFDEIDGAPNLGVSGASRTVLNVRVRPSTRMAVVDQLDWGDTFEIIGRTRQDGKDFWYQIRFVNDKKEEKIGWVSAQYVTARGNMNNVPVR